MKIKTILVDVGGVLVRTESTALRHVWEEKLNLEPHALSNEIFKNQPAKEATVGLVSAIQIWENVKIKYKLSDAEAIQLQSDFTAGDILNEELYSYLAKLHKFLRIVLFTNAWDNARKIDTERFNLDKISDMMIISGEVGLRKPNKKFFKYTLATLQDSPSEIIFIDDKISNIKVGKQMGLQTVHFIHTGTAITEIEKLLA